MKNEKYNGYKNYNTWLIVVNLTNDYNFYKSVTEKKKNGHLLMILKINIKIIL